MLSTAIAATAAAPAPAAPRANLRLDTGPILAGRGYLWGEAHPSRVRVLYARPGRRAGVVFRQRLRPRGIGRERILGELSASSRSFAFTYTREQNSPSILYAGRLGRRARLLRRCPETFATGLSGSVLATIDVGSTCGGAGEQTISVRDLATGRRTDLQRAPREDGGVRIAGRYVAYTGTIYEDNLPGTQDADVLVVVYDRQAGRVVFRTPAGGELGRDFDMGANGTLVYLEAEARRGRLAWSSPSEPSAHRIDLRVAETFQRDVALAGTRVAYERRVGRLSSEIVVKDLGRGRAVVVKRLRRTRRGGVKRVGDIDFDGRRIAYATQRFRRLREPIHTESGERRFKHARAVIHVRRAP